MSLIRVRRTATLEGEDKRDGKDSIAADANFKKGDKVTVKTKWAGTRKGIVKEVINDPALKKAYVVEIEGAETAAYPAEIVSADVKDAAAADAKFKKGDKVRRGKQTGIVRDIEKEPYIEVKFTDQPVTVFVHESEIVAADSRAADACGTDAEFKVGDKVKDKTRMYMGAAKIIDETDDEYVVKFDNGRRDIIAKTDIVVAADSCAADYDPNPQTRGKDIEVFSAQAIREESACENVLRKVIEDVEALVIKIHGPMSSWEEVIENSEMSPELPQAKKWSGTANRRYDYLLARERAISSILSELKRNHID